MREGRSCDPIRSSFWGAAPRRTGRTQAGGGASGCPLRSRILRTVAQKRALPHSLVEIASQLREEWLAVDRETQRIWSGWRFHRAPNLGEESRSQCRSGPARPLERRGLLASGGAFAEGAAARSESPPLLLPRLQTCRAIRRRSPHGIGYQWR